MVTTELEVVARSRAAAMPRLARRVAWALWLVAALLAVVSIILVIGSLSLGIAQADYVRGSGFDASAAAAGGTSTSTRSGASRGVSSAAAGFW